MCFLSSIVTLKHLLTNDDDLFDKTVTAYGRRARWEPVSGHCHFWPQVLIPGMEKIRWDPRKRTGQASRVSRKHVAGAMPIHPPLLSPNPQCLPRAHHLLGTQWKGRWLHGRYFYTHFLCLAVVQAHQEFSRALDVLGSQETNFTPFTSAHWASLSLRNQQLPDVTLTTFGTIRWVLWTYVWLGRLWRAGHTLTLMYHNEL